MPARHPSVAEFERAVLLALISLGEDAYGVSIRDALQARLRRSISFGAVYTTLDRLQAKEMVTTRYGDPTPQRGGRAKKFFRITRRGLKGLESARRESEAIWAIAPLPGSR